MYPKKDIPSLPFVNAKYATDGKIYELLEQHNGMVLFLTPWVTCPKCDGSGKVVCPKCRGSGKVNGETCFMCNGEKEVKCRYCDGKGKIYED